MMSVTPLDQNTLFPDVSAQPEVIRLPDAELVYVPAAFARERADELLEKLLGELAWRKETIRIAGREIPVPRLTAWYGDERTEYQYSGIRHRPNAWLPDLQRIRETAQELAETRFNSVLANLYRDGRDSVAWHSDEERELGRQPVIASVSFGAARLFNLRHKTNRRGRYKLELGHGSVLIMRGDTQHHWQHQVPKQPQIEQPRINLTFRTISQRRELP